MASAPNTLDGQIRNRLVLGAPDVAGHAEVRLFYGHEWVATCSLAPREDEVFAPGMVLEYQVTQEQLALIRGQNGATFFSTGGAPAEVKIPMNERTMAEAATGSVSLGATGPITTGGVDVEVGEDGVYKIPANSLKVGDRVRFAVPPEPIFPIGVAMEDLKAGEPIAVSSDGKVRRSGREQVIDPEPTLSEVLGDCVEAITGVVAAWHRLVETMKNTKTAIDSLAPLVKEDTDV